MKISQEQMDDLCNDILEGVDYDIFKEDLEDRTSLDEIAMKIANVLNIEVE